LMHGRIGVMEEYVVVGSSLMGAHRLGFLAALAVRVLLVVPACGLPVVYLIVIGWLMLGSWIVLRFRSLLC